MDTDSLIVQDNPGSPQPPKKTWRAKLFQLLFKGIEAVWMLTQIIQCIRQLLGR